jgi:hypothetical protein
MAREAGSTWMGAGGGEKGAMLRAGREAFHGGNAGTLAFTVSHTAHVAHLMAGNSCRVLRSVQRRVAMTLISESRSRLSDAGPMNLRGTDG